MELWLNKYRGFEVEVIYLTDNNMYRDRGEITDVAEQWIELQKGGGQGEVFLVPISAIRLLKVIAPPPTADNRLLRPAIPEPEQEQGVIARKQE